MLVNTVGYVIIGMYPVIEEAADLSAYKRLLWRISKWDRLARRFTVFFAVATLTLAANIFISAYAFATVAVTRGEPMQTIFKMVGGLSFLTLALVFIYTLKGVWQAGDLKPHVSRDARETVVALSVVTMVLGVVLLLLFALLR